MKNENFVSFMVKLSELHVSNHYSEKLFNLDNMVFSMYKGNTSVDRIITITLKQEPQDLPLDVFGRVDELCKEYDVVCNYADQKFKFTIKVKI